MATLFFIVILLSVYHFVMETLVLPALKEELRFKLLKLRSKLCNLKLQAKDKLDGKTFSDLDAAIVFNHNHMDSLNLVDFMTTMKSIKNDRKLIAQADSDIKRIENMNLPEAKAIFEKFNKYFILTLAVNCGAWGLYFLPIIPFILLTRLMKRFWRKSDRRAKNLAFVISEKRHFPAEEPHAIRVNVTNGFDKIRSKWHGEIAL
ncbi:MAG: hypothetical protein JWR61_3786 [Ferruginibacter sp.]|uniref:hypothetical protein n=1 Tax=Ferruginibacter sp. TaxID=1940288 RepID=UPI002659775F|nr:hypothetical protein [Ferruginibacter sp.]MDB5278831.1 hypothetical protein [Ferruginibacter sp.]